MFKGKASVSPVILFLPQFCIFVKLPPCWAHDVADPSLWIPVDYLLSSLKIVGI